MKIVVIGGTGLIGGKLVERLRGGGHEVVAASPSTGVDAVTGEGLAGALTGAAAVVDVTNAPSFADEAVMAFFVRSSRNLLAAEAEAGVRHHVALSVVGTDGLTVSGYFRAKLAQEELITAGPIPSTIVRATQFFEFLDGIAQAATRDGRVHLPRAQMQPMLSDDVAAALAEVALAAPAGGRVEIAGPEPFRMDEIVRRLLTARGDPRPVVTDPAASYFGIALDERSLLPGPQARLAPTRFDAWLQRTALRG
ncbi:SDR family oxidoreductase [Methylobacterium isbiliense]|uniref:NmrA family transcriptional regulator n=1 Tax=Methylobacterium isbiliense TaxID=315478 RepID=A0ABQ4SIT4_9HYPH|nr:SDR family oxidoreductase [Methylobacterium isbiliense]MDN3622404.1 SDR family oxidoreductase [Methylobacterium isbiliense]GJE01566.1 hypothetical protein GMJLKIPL_3500 [Methylobacterium isbiliense]